MNINYNPIARISSALLRTNPKESLMAFITGYFDESYSQLPKPLIYTVAGYISTDEKWIKFQEKWQAVLDRENIPYFSSKNISKFNKDWSKTKKDSFSEEIVAIIKETYLGGFSASVIVDDYNALADKFRFELGTPHFIAMTKCFKLIEEWCNEINFQKSIHYVFEKGAKDNKSLGLHYSEILTNDIQKRYRIETFGFAPKRPEDSAFGNPYTPLQAADMLAYETRKDVMRRFPTEKPREMRGSLENLIDWTRNRWSILDKNYFQWVINQPYFQNLPDDEKYMSLVAEAKKQGKI